MGQALAQVLHPTHFSASIIASKWLWAQVFGLLKSFKTRITEQQQSQQVQTTKPAEKTTAPARKPKQEKTVAAASNKPATDSAQPVLQQVTTTKPAEPSRPAQELAAKPVPAAPVQTEAKTEKKPMPTPVAEAQKMTQVFTKDDD